MASTLYFMRHGETDWNAEGRLQGQQDTPLNNHGREQAGEAGRRLASILPHPDSLPWLVSPMWRTRETADLARAAIDLPAGRYELDARLKELTFGQWEGKTWKELRRSDAPAVEARATDKWNYVPPDGESYGMLARRIRGWLDSLTGDSVIVSHGGVARVLFVIRAGMSEQEAAEATIHQGRLLILRGETAEWY